jgi:ABC-type Fe3+ transport system substrate-binding protein
MSSLRRGLPLLLVLVLGATACSPPSPPGATTGARPAAGPAQGASGGQAAAGEWKAEWDRTLAAAKAEGRVMVWGPPGDLIRKNITEGFRKAFPDITIEWLGTRSAEQATKLEAERIAGVYSVDVFIGGTTTALTQVKPIGALEPIQPALILPEVTDPSNWLDGRLEFSDYDGTLNLVFVTMPTRSLAYDPKQVKDEDVDTLPKLLDPKWRGKLVINDPRPSGSANVQFRWFWEMLGPEQATDYIKAIRAQAAVVDRDQRRQVEWIARGRYPVLVGASDGVLQQLAQEGLVVGTLPEFKDHGVPVTASFGSLMLINRPPHPNAAKMFANWLLGKDGQTAYSTAMVAPSRRLDVPRDHLPAEAIPRAGGKYWRSYTEDAVSFPPALDALLKDVFAN